MSRTRNDMTGFLLTHTLIRQTVPELARRLGATPVGDTEAVQRLTAWWHVFTGILDRHHDVEDRLVWPVVLAERPDLRHEVDEIEDQHAELDTYLADIDLGLSGLACDGTPGTWPDRVARLRADVTAFDAMLVDHLVLEEKTMVPVLEEQVSPEAFAALGAELAKGHTPAEMATEMPMVVSCASPQQRTVMLGRMPEPVRQRFTQEWEPQFQALVSALPDAG